MPKGWMSSTSRFPQSQPNHTPTHKISEHKNEIVYILQGHPISPKSLTHLVKIHQKGNITQVKAPQWDGILQHPTSICNPCYPIIPKYHASATTRRTRHRSELVMSTMEDEVWMKEASVMYLTDSAGTVRISLLHSLHSLITSFELN